MTAIRNPRSAIYLSFFLCFEEVLTGEVDADAGGGEDGDAGDDEARMAFEDGATGEDESAAVKYADRQGYGEGMQEGNAEQACGVVLHKERNSGSDAQHEGELPEIGARHGLPALPALTQDARDERAAGAGREPMGPCDVEKDGADGESASVCRAAPDDAGEDEQRRCGACKAGKDGDGEEEPGGVLAAPVEELGHGEEKLKVECLVSFSELGKSSEAHSAWTERSGVKAERKRKKSLPRRRKGR